MLSTGALEPSKLHITFVDYEGFYTPPAVANLRPVSGPKFDWIHILVHFPITEPDTGPGVQRDTTDIHSSHTGRSSDCYIDIVTSTSPAYDLPQQYGLPRSCDMRIE